jgi:hypothetical protein
MLQLVKGGYFPALELLLAANAGEAPLHVRAAAELQEVGRLEEQLMTHSVESPS